METDSLCWMTTKHLNIFSDDRYKKVTVKDTENKIISNVYSIAEDLDGNIWVGTDQGPLIYYNPEKYLIGI